MKKEIKNFNLLALVKQTNKISPEFSVSLRTVLAMLRILAVGWCISYGRDVSCGLVPQYYLKYIGSSFSSCFYFVEYWCFYIIKFSFKEK